MSAHATAKGIGTADRWQGDTVSGFPLRQYLGGRNGNAVFVTEYNGQKAAIKLIVPDRTAKGFDAVSLLTSLTKLDHPHVMRTFSAGKCKIRGEERLYVVMEFADENLSQVIPSRALTADEGKQMLAAVVEALAYIHQNGFVHGHLKPANIMVVAEEIKLSTDGICREGQRVDTSREPDAYAAPESSLAGASAAADVWSLGITLVEALTQQLPSASQDRGLVYPTLPEPLQQIARKCLQVDPRQRWTTAEITACLRESAVAVQPVERRKSLRAWAYGGAAAVLAIAAIAAAPKILHRSAIESPASTSTPAAPGTASMPSASSPVTGVPRPSTVSSAGAIAHEVVPEVPASARRTVHGTIKVRVRTEVDSAGNVTTTHLETAGPSKYFARLAVQASEQWKFTPPQENGQVLPSRWKIEYGFTRAGAKATASALKGGRPAY